MITELRALVGKELRQTVRDRKMLVLLVAAPAIQLLVLGFSANLDVVSVDVVIADEDRTAASRAFADGLVAGDTFELVGDARGGPVGPVLHGEHAAHIVGRGEAAMAVIIPPGFGRAFEEGVATQVQVLVDGSDSIQATVAQNGATAYTISRGLEVRRAQLQSQSNGAFVAWAPTTIVPRTLYNQSLDSHLHFVPGIAAALLLVITMVVTAMGLSREDEAGTLEQVLVTPLSPGTLVLGKTLPYAVIGLVDLALVVAVGAVVFDVPIRGSLFILFGSGLLYMLTTLGLGLLAGTIASSQQQAFFNAAIVLFPAMILSGFISPIQAMPEWLQPLTALDPMRHFVEILRAVLLKDAGLIDLAPNIVALAGMGLVTFALAGWALLRKLR